MGTYSGGCGSPGENLGNGTHSIGISLAANEYPTKVTFWTSSGGSYWTNCYTGVTSTGTISLCDTSGGNAYQLDTMSLGGGKSNPNTPSYSLSGTWLKGCSLAIKISTEKGFRLRNWCSITVETAEEEEAAPVPVQIQPEPAFDPDVYNKLLPTITQDDKLIGLARRSTWKVTVNGVDTTDEIEKDLLSIEITDNEESSADDLQIKMSDTTGKWLQQWLNETVQKGAKTNGLSFAVWIGTHDHTGKICQQKAGTFLLDSMKHGGPPAQVTIKCVSLNFEGGIRNDKNDKSWENITLKNIAQEFAGKGGLRLLYCSDINPRFSRKEQDQETDIAFLIRLCDGAGLSVKISDYQLIIFDRRQFENADALQKIVFGDGSYSKWDLGTGSGEVTYDICEVKYTDPASGQCIRGEYKSQAWHDEEARVAEANADKDEDDEYEVAEHTKLTVTNVKVSSIAEANERAEIELNLKNLFERTVTLTVPGNPALMAGLRLDLENFGYWCGKYMINKCTHSISKSGYQTKLKLRYIGPLDDPNAVALQQTSQYSILDHLRDRAQQMAQRKLQLMEESRKKAEARAAFNQQIMNQMMEARKRQ